MRTTFLFVLLFSVHRKMVIVKSASLILTIMHANDNIMFIMEDTITHGISILHVCFFLIKIRWCIIFTLVKVLVKNKGLLMHIYIYVQMIILKVRTKIHLYA